jgi:ribonuclease HI
MTNQYFTIIHTDGGASPNPGEAAYAAILQHGDKVACVRGYVPHATNQQMELAAVIAALHALKSTRIPVQVVTDSQYVHNGASKWINGWRKNGWRASRPIKNRELWQELDTAMSCFVISWVKVTGHGSSLMNNQADSLVQDTRQAEGDPSRYRVTDIPTIESTWSYLAFEQSRPLNPKAAALKQRFQAIRASQ